MQAAAEILRAPAQALPARTAPKGVDELTKAIAGYEAAVDEVRREGLTKDLPTVRSVACLPSVSFWISFEEISKILSAEPQRFTGANSNHGSSPGRVSERRIFNRRFTRWRFVS